jgi:hypothetical protein
MFLLGFEIIGFALLFYGIREICNIKNSNNISEGANYNNYNTINTNYQPPPRYEYNSNTGRHNNINQDPPPSYSEK